MALSVHVLRSDYDCTNGGVTARENSFTLLGENEPVPAGRGPFLRVVKRTFGREVYVHAEPVEARHGMIGPMSGGNFVHTSDSRYRDLVGHDYPISVHDRFDTVADYNSNF
jgi:hypothetical protein